MIAFHYRIRSDRPSRDVATAANQGFGKDDFVGELTEMRHFYYALAWQVLEERPYALQNGI